MKLLIPILFLSFCYLSCNKDESSEPAVQCGLTEEETYPIVEIETHLGMMRFWLYDQTPNHKAKFMELANEEHYDSFTFNRIVTNFVVQGGCPDSPQYFENSPYIIPPEFVDSIRHDYGALGMGRDDNPEKNSNACQFYIVNKESGLSFLDGDYTVFGKIIDGEEVLESIEIEPTDNTDTPITDIPLQVTIKEYSVEELLTLFDFAI